MRAAILMLLAAAPAHPSQQFDLECSGPPSTPRLSLAQAHVHFRFDLASGKWCEADCGQVHGILELQPTVIYLDNSPDDTPAALMHYRYIDRQTGQYIYLSRSTFEAASCVKQPFSGFPKFETKF